MPQIKDFPVLSSVPSGGYVLISDPTADPTKSIFAKVPVSSVAASASGSSAVAFEVGFDQGAVVVPGTITVVRKAPFPLTITSLDYENETGSSFTVAVAIDGVPVTGLSGIAVNNATIANAVATGGSSVGVGQAITLVVSSVTGSPTNAHLQINATRAAGQLTPALPGQPASVAVTPLSGQNVITPAAVSAYPPVTGYNIYRGTAPNAESATQIATNVAVPYTDSGLANGTTYYYKAAAVNAVGTGQQSPEGAGTPTVLQAAPAAPASLTVVAGNGQNIITPATVSANPSVSGYTIYRGTSPGAESGTPIATNVAIPFTDTGLTNGQIYYYKVAAVNAVGASPQSPEASGTPTTSPSSAAPNAPTITATATSSSAITLTIIKSSSGGLPVSYTVQRSTAADFSVNLVAINGGSAITYTAATQTFNDAGLQAGTHYYYRASATNAVGTSANSTATNATTSSGGGSSYLNSLPTVAAAGAPILAFDASTLTGTNGAAVPSATDQSVNALAFTQSTPGNQPALHTASVNGRNTLTLTTGRFLKAAASGALAGAHTSDLTILVVTKARSVAATYDAYPVFYAGSPDGLNGTFLWASYNSATTTMFGRINAGNPVYAPPSTNANAIPTNTLGKHVCRYTASSGLMRHYTGDPNSESTGTIAPGATPWTIAEIGTPGSNDVEVCEVVFWKGLATDAERDGIYSYANGKWDTVGQLTPAAPAAPASLTVTAGNAQNTVTPSTVSAYPAVTGYNIYRSTSAGNEGGTPFVSNVAIPYADTGLTNGTTYYYRAAAVNSVGVGPQSPEGSGTPAVTTDPGPPVPTAASPYGVYFDAIYYLTQNPDVKAAGIDPLQHYNNFGWKEGRNPSALFDTKLFLAAYPDVAAQNVNPLAYFTSTGYALGERAIPVPPPPAPPPAPPLPPYGSAPALTGIIWNQPTPLHPAAGFGCMVGFCLPVGGMGPFSWAVNSADNSKYGMLARNGTGTVWSPWTTFGTSTDVITLSCTDARGVTVTSTQTVQKTDGTQPAVMFNDRNPTWNVWVDPYFNGPMFRAHMVDTTGAMYRGDDGGGWSMQVLQGDGTPSPFQLESSEIRYKGTGRPLAGNYPMRLVYTNDNPAIATIMSPLFTVVVRDPPPITQAEFKPGVISTSTLAGTFVGMICANASGNGFGMNLTDDAGLLQYDYTTRRVTLAKQPTTPGPVNGILTIFDESVVGRFSFTFNVEVGVTVNPNLMTFVQASGLDNAAVRQRLGQVVIDPSVTFSAGAPRFAITHQTRFNPMSLTDANPARITIDDSGVLNSTYMMSEGFDDFTVTATDGITTVTNTFRVTIARCPNVVNYYVGAGNPATRGGGVPTSATKLATYEQFRAACMAEHPTTFLQFFIDDDANPEVYVNGNVRSQDYGLRFAFQGPGAITWIGQQSPGGSRPNAWFGGPWNAGPGGGDMRGKGCLVMGHGDWTLTGLPVRYTHGPDSLVLGLEGIRKDGETTGDLTLIGCEIRCNDNGFEAGTTHTIVTLDHCLLSEGGTSHVSAGACHNIYCGSVYKFIMKNCKSRGSTLGHLVKSRAMISEVTNNELFDGLWGSSSCCADFPNGGQVTFSNNFVEKGTMVMNPYAVQYAAEGNLHDVNTFTFDNNTISILTLDGNHFGSPAGFGIFNQLNKSGIPVTGTITNTKYYYAPNSNAKFRMAVLASYGNLSDVVNISGTTVLTEPPVFDVTNPWYAGNLPQMEALYFHGLWGQDYYDGFEGVMHVTDRDQIVIHRSDGPGTVLVNAYGHTHRLDNTPNVFVSGTTASFTHGPNYYKEALPPDPWAPNSWFNLSVAGDGQVTVTLAVAASTIPTSVTQFQLVITAPNGWYAVNRYTVKIIT